MEHFLERTSWFRKAGYGFFFHFLNGGAGGGTDAGNKTAEWNQLCNAFNVKKLAKQLHELGAGYCYITVGQNSGYYCSPNSHYDSYLGYTAETSKCSRRDLVSDFADALEEYHIPLLVYTTSMAPAGDAHATVGLNCLPPWDASKNGAIYKKLTMGNDPRLTEFQKKWNAIHTEWAERWGKKVHGWWVDGCYYGKEMYDFPEEPNYASFAKALRAGNPEALIGFNPGVKYPPFTQSAEEDYTGGETNEPWKNILQGPVCSNAQYHILTFAGKFWRQGPLMYSANELASITRAVTGREGVITWDVPFNGEDGSFLPEFYDAFLKMKELLAHKSFPVPFVNMSVEKLPEIGGCAGRVFITTDTDDVLEVEVNGKKTVLSGAREYHLKIDAPENLPNGPIRLIVRSGVFEKRFDVPYRFTCDLKKGKFVTEFRSDAGEKTGTFGLSMQDGKLLIEADVLEPDPRPASIPWHGSCLELFLAGECDAQLIRQFFLKPDGSFLYLNGSDYVPVETLSVKYEKTAAGYHAVVTCPFSEIRSFNGKEFRVTAMLTVNRPNGKVVSILFGVHSCLADIDRFAVVKL